MTTEISGSTKVPGVTIGVPVYNEAEFAAEAIQSAACQAEVVIVSDNASSDSTGEICRELVKRLPNVFYVRHPVNLGASRNFEYVLECARTPFFMWLGGHDTIPPSYCRDLLQAMEDSEAVLAFSEARHIDRAGSVVSVYRYPYRQRIEASDAWERLYALVSELTDCTLVYGLWRRDDLLECVDGGKYAAADHVVLSRAAARRPFIFVESTYYGRRITRIEPPDELAIRQVRMMTGNEGIETLPPDPYRALEIATMAVAKRLPAPNPWARWRRQKEVRRRLVERFGPF